MEVFVLLDI